MKTEGKEESEHVLHFRLNVLLTGVALMLVGSVASSTLWAAIPCVLCGGWMCYWAAFRSVVGVLPLRRLAVSVDSAMSAFSRFCNAADKATRLR